MSDLYSGIASEASHSLDVYLREISRYRLIDREREAELARRIRNDDQEALDELVRSNLRFVVSVAKRYQKQGVALADLINEGNVGLLRAARKFDPDKGIKFISYAVWWIRQAILQSIAEQRGAVRIPLSKASLAYRIGRISNVLSQEFGREPSVEELAIELEVPEEEISRALFVNTSHLSLDAPLREGEEVRLLDVLVDDSEDSPDDSVYSESMRGAIEEALLTLKEREAKVVRLYFGLDGAEALTLEQIGRQLGVTRERVRQIKERALLRLKHRSRARTLETFAAST